VVGLAGVESPREDLVQVDTSEAPESPTEKLSDDVIFRSLPSKLAEVVSTATQLPGGEEVTECEGELGGGEVEMGACTSAVSFSRSEHPATSEVGQEDTTVTGLSPLGRPLDGEDEVTVVTDDAKVQGVLPVVMVTGGVEIERAGV
jgi:hypothetical protein